MPFISVESCIATPEASNIKTAGDGATKILDFGLAKSTAADGR
jgi:hypothetical protein